MTDRATKYHMFKTQSSYKKSIFFTKGKLRCLVSGVLPEFMLSVLVDEVLQELIVPALESGEFTNVKGRDPQDLIEADLSHKKLPQKDEVFFLSGEIPDIEDGKPGQVQIAYQTEFAEFQGHREILHTLKEARTGSLPSSIPSVDTGKVFPFTPLLLRFGLNMFSPRYIPMIGLIPTVSETLLLEATDQKILLEIKSDQKNSGLPPLLTEKGYFEKLQNIFQQNFDYDLQKKLLDSL